MQKKLSQIIKNFIKFISREGFTVFKSLLKGQLYLKNILIFLPNQQKPTIKVKKPMDTLRVSPQTSLTEEGKRLLAVTSFDVTNSVFNIADENQSFSISTPGYTSDPESVYKLNEP